jgi:spectinomycin phosphotransferase
VLQRVPRERFVPDRRQVITQLEELIHRQAFADDLQEEWVAFWQSQRDVIHTLVNRVDAIGEHLRKTSTPRALCHADMHPWNLHLGGDGNWWLIDWDDVVLALKERDLMFVVGGIGGDGVGSQETEWFLQGYGNDDVDPLALAYYRTAWAVQDIGAYSEELFFTPHLGRESRRAALQGFQSLFAPGNIVERALASFEGPS